MKFRLPSFVIEVRDLTAEEWAAQADKRRDYYMVTIRTKGHGNLRINLPVGSPVIMTAGRDWNETEAARSAISFASCASDVEDPGEALWIESFGEELSNEAFCHRILGSEMRRG